MRITAAELKNNLGKYLIMAEYEDILITKNGRTVARLSSPHLEKRGLVKELFGSIPDTITEDEAREERLAKL